MSRIHGKNPDWSRPVAEPGLQRVAVLIPCHNEESTIVGVIRDFRAQLPMAMIVVCDNDSSDRTRALAHSEGASVIIEKRRGKGYAVQTLFKSVDADIYVMVDGDGTYPANEVGRLIEPVHTNQAEMVVGSRLHAESNSAFRTVNKAGNKIFVFLIGRIFGVQLTDVLSGYRAFSGIFVKSTPLFTGGFDIEVEMTMRALQRRSQIVEIPVDLVSRPEGSHSKIRIIRDGLAILRSVLSFFRDYKPLSFFGSIGALLVLAGCVPGSVVILQFIQTGFVHRLPSAVLAVGLVLSGLINFVVGVILHTTARRFQEIDAQLRLMGQSIRSERTRE